MKQLYQKYLPLNKQVLERVFDILKNGTSIFSSPVAISAGVVSVQSGNTFNVTAVSEGDEFTINTSSVGSGVQYVNVTLFYIVKNN